jgi:O-antigen/teichoic acid export membrane protein
LFTKLCYETAVTDRPSSATGEPRTTPARGVYRSAATAVLLQWSMRCVGLVSVLVLARVLTPEDFGIVGIAMATVAIVEIFGAIGLRQSLLRISEPSRDHMDTAWTLQIIVLVLLALLTVPAAPLAAAIYQDPRLTPVIIALAGRFLFLALVNIGTVDFDRHLDFGIDMKMRLFSRIGALFVTLAAALVLRSYWALVLGLLAQSALLAFGSYLFHPYRPRLCLKERAALLGFSIWMLIGWAAQTAQQQVERLVAASLGGAHLTGLYSVSKDLSEIFTQEITTALDRVTFVTIASSGEPLGADRSRIVRIVGGYAVIAAPLGLGLAATAESTVAVLLGTQWVEAAPLLKIVAVASAILAVYRAIGSTLTAAGFAARAALQSLAGAMLTALACVIAGLVWRDALAVATAALGGSLALLLVGLADLGRRASLSMADLAVHVARPFAAAVLMYGVVRLLPDLGIPFANLLLAVGFGAPLYALLVIGAWAASGRPDGAETEALALARALAARAGLGRRLPG